MCNSSDNLEKGCTLKRVHWYCINSNPFSSYRNSLHLNKIYYTKVLTLTIQKTIVWCLVMYVLNIDISDVMHYSVFQLGDLKGILQQELALFFGEKYLNNIVIEIRITGREVTLSLKRRVIAIPAYFCKRKKIQIIKIYYS